MRYLGAIFCLAGLSPLASSQAVVISGNAGFNADSPYNRLYNTKSVVTIRGRVNGLHLAPPMEGMGNAITLLVRGADGVTWHIDVGPEWYVNNQRTRIEVRNDVQVTGSRVRVEGKDLILAEQIVKGKSVLSLRRPSGRPYWDAVSSDSPGGVDRQAISGDVVKIDTFIDGTNGATARMTLRTDNGQVLVALAPDWFMKQQAVRLSLGDYVTVSVFAPAGASPSNPPLVFATSINVGQKWIVLRTTSGVPMWYGADGG